MAWPGLLFPVGSAPVLARLPSLAMCNHSRLMLWRCCGRREINRICVAVKAAAFPATANLRIPSMLPAVKRALRLCPCLPMPPNSGITLLLSRPAAGTTSSRGTSSSWRGSTQGPTGRTPPFSGTARWCEAPRPTPLPTHPFPLRLPDALSMPLSLLFEASTDAAMRRLCHRHLPPPSCASVTCFLSCVYCHVPPSFASCHLPHVPPSRAAHSLSVTVTALLGHAGRERQRGRRGGGVLWGQKEEGHGRLVHMCRHVTAAGCLNTSVRRVRP